jgi:flagella basal body P-ring formation protein FlgA
MRIVLLFISILGHCVAAAAVSAPPCYPVSSELIGAADLARAVPQFSRLRPELTFGFAPVPGMERVFRIGDLKRIAEVNHITADIQKNACFCWTLSPLGKDRILNAMRNSLGPRQSEIEILNISNTPVPAGDLFFPLEGLSAFSEKPVVWRGYISYTAKRRFFVWALVQVKISEQHLVAVREIHHGETLSPDAFRSETYVGPIPRDKLVHDLRLPVQAFAARDIPAGATLLANMLTMLDEVEKGDSVTAIAISGAARIEAQGVATQTGSSGDTILVKNMRSGRLFKARVLGRGKVLVVPSFLSGLAPGENKS